MVTPDIGLIVGLIGFITAFLSVFVGGILMVAGKPGNRIVERVFFVCLLLLPVGLFMALIGFILMCYGFAVQILPAAS